MYLDDTTKSIEVVLGEAIATDECDITAAYEELTATSFTIGANDLTTNGTDAVVAVAPPASDTKRRIKELTIYNADTITHDVIVRYASADGDRVLWSGEIASEGCKYWDSGNWVADVDLAGTDLPVMDGVAATGVSIQFAREDHVHPTDTSRAPLASPVFTGNPTAPNPTIGDDSTQIATTGWVQDVIAQLAHVPVGTIAYFPANAAPTGWLPINGALVSRSTYAALWDYANNSGNITASDGAWSSTTAGQFSPGNGSTTFRVPDGRGEFVRGWDNSRGIDSGRTIGSYQADAMQGHIHGLSAYKEAGSLGGTPGYNPLMPAAQGAYSAPPTDGPTNDGVSGSPRTAAETRPRNVAWLACIKY